MARSLISRIIVAYQATLKEGWQPTGSFWDTQFAKLKRPIHDALMAGDMEMVGATLANPITNNLLWGFEALAADLIGSPSASLEDLRTLTAEKFHRLLLAWGLPRYDSVEDALSDLDGVAGIHVDFPEPFIGDVGLPSSRGTATERGLDALYQAWRVFRHSPARVVEIGAGLGRTAYYARRMGIMDYTIIDIPMTAVAQAYFLGRVLGEDTVCLYGERRPGIRILPPAAFLGSNDRYDVVFNIDSWTEMDPKSAFAYIHQAQARANVVWSVNHEANPFRVFDLWGDRQRIERHPYWLRSNYMDETYIRPRRRLWR